jgi:glyoxylase-like metal-dependent hydrolase (beta-lactamase superfamily II)
VGKLTGTVLATQGHTLDSISLAFPGLVFTGDALFSGSIGGTSSPRNAQQEIDHVRRNILSLPDDYEIHPGHGPSSTVAIERNHNPFFV